MQRDRLKTRKIDTEKQTQREREKIQKQNKTHRKRQRDRERQSVRRQEIDGETADRQIEKERKMDRWIDGLIYRDR